MKLLSDTECQQIHGGLTEKQVDSLLAKIGGYTAKAGLLGIMYCAGHIGLHSFLLSGVAVAIVKIAGVYVFYENKESILSTFNQAKNYFFSDEDDLFDI